MAEIKVQIKGDDSDLKSKFRESSADARVFSESVEKSLDAIKTASQAVVSQTGLGGIAKLLGGAGLLGAIDEFSHRLVQGFKDAIKAALDYQAVIGKTRSALGMAFGGQAEHWTEQVEKISAAMGGFEPSIAIFQGLARNMVPEQAFKNLIDIQNSAKMLGVGLDELGEKFVEMRSEGEVEPRMFKEMPALAARVRTMLPPGPTMPGVPEEENLAARVKAAGGVDWLFKTVLPALAPGGLQAPVRLGAEASTRGQFLTITEEFNKRWRELGQDLLPIVNESLRELKAEMPAVTESFKTLGEELQRDVPKVVGFLKDFFGTGERLEHPTTAFGRGFKTVNDYLDTVEQRIGELFTNPSQLLKDAAAEQKAAAADLHRVVNPKQ